MLTHELFLCCVLQAVNVVSTVVAIILVDRLGRRFLFIQGGVQMILCEVRGLDAAVGQCCCVGCLYFMLLCWVLACPSCRVSLDGMHAQAYLEGH